MGGEGWLLTPCWPGSSWPARSPAPCLTGQGWTGRRSGRGEGVLATAWGTTCPTLSLLLAPPASPDSCLGARSLLGLPCPNPHPSPFGGLAGHSGLPFSAFPPQPSPSKPKTHPRPRAPQAQPALGGAIYIRAVVYPISPGPAKKNPPGSWPLRTASSPQGTVGKLGCPGPRPPTSS